MKSKLILVVLGVLYLGFMVADVQAFCLYNHTDKLINVKVTSGGNFEVNLQPYLHTCCLWFEKECNPSGKKDHKVTFHASYFVTDYRTYIMSTICDNFKIKFNEAIKVEGSNGSYRCVRIDY